eukprot:IDg10762t1
MVNELCTQDEALSNRSHYADARGWFISSPVPGGSALRAMKLGLAPKDVEFITGFVLDYFASCPKYSNISLKIIKKHRAISASALR